MKSKIETFISKMIMLPFMLALLLMAGMQKIIAIIKRRELNK
jgi:hypothetical protein